MTWHQRAIVFGLGSATGLACACLACGMMGAPVTAKVVLLVLLGSVTGTLLGEIGFSVLRKVFK